MDDRMKFLRQRLGLIAAVTIVLMIVPVLATVLVVWLGSGDGGRSESGTCGEAAYRVSTTIADSSEVFLELELVDRVPDRTWQVRWRDERFGSYTFDAETDASGRLATRTVMGDTDDGDMLREVAFRPAGSEVWCSVQGHID
jgi:hypothetical protein